MKRYARYIVYGRWPTAPGEPEDIYRPHASFDMLVEAIDYFDSAIADDAGGPGPTCQYKMIDLEHLDLGDMMSRRSAGQRSRRPASAWRPRKAGALQHHLQGRPAHRGSITAGSANGCCFGR